MFTHFQGKTWTETKGDILNKRYGSKTCKHLHHHSVVAKIQNQKSQTSESAEGGLYKDHRAPTAKTEILL